jgi:hypothetical protein
MGCSSVSKVSVPLVYKELFKRVGCEDKNGNGVIDKPSIWNLGIKEGYKNELDSNKDGEINPQEASDNYYANRENPTNYAFDAELMVENARIYDDGSQRLMAAADVVLEAKGLEKSQRLNLLQEVLAMARTLKNPEDRIRTFLVIATKMVKVHMDKELVEGVLKESEQRDKTSQWNLRWISEIRAEMEATNKK